jgi:hypothetical protein
MTNIGAIIVDGERRLPVVTDGGERFVLSAPDDTDEDNPTGDTDSSGDP